MNPISIEDQPETVDHSTPSWQYGQQSNVLDLLGVSTPPTARRAKKNIPPEEENYSHPLIDLRLLRKR